METISKGWICSKILWDKAWLDKSFAQPDK